MEHVEQERQLWIGGETRALELFEVRIRKEAAVRKHPSLEKPPSPLITASATSPYPTSPPIPQDASQSVAPFFLWVYSPHKNILTL